MTKPKYYYDYTRNTGDEKINSDCSCERKLKECVCLYSEAVQKRLKEWVETRTAQLSDCEMCAERVTFEIWSENIQDVGCCKDKE